MTPAHPYTVGLMASKPVINKKTDSLYNIPGAVPNPIDMPNYCYFRDRCESCVPGCDGEYPAERKVSETHFVSCYRYGEADLKPNEAETEGGEPQ
jgi:peptide/nickel transport system ATP-binding protein